MKRLRIVSLDARLVVLAGAAAVIVAACRRGADSGADTTGGTPAPSVAATTIAACRISSDSVGRLTRGEFVAWASKLAYDAQNPSWGQANGFDAAAEVRVERARGMPDATQRDLGDGCVIARVFSRTAYPRIGLGRGWTYIWADSSSPYTASFVPEDTSAAVVGQNMSVDSTPPLTVASPGHICSGCGRDWCVYPTDTLGAPPVVFEPGPTGIGLVDVLGGAVAVARETRSR